MANTARIINLGIVVPPDLEFRMPDGRAFKVNGDVGMATMMRLARLEQGMLEQQEELEQLKAADDDDGYKRVGDELLSTLEDLSDEVLAILRVHQPELEEMPFSQYDVGVFLAALRGSLGEIAGADPTSPPAVTTGTESRAARRKSTRSSGSRASSRPSGSRRTTGSE